MWSEWVNMYRNCCSVEWMGKCV